MRFAHAGCWVLVVVVVALAACASGRDPSDPLDRGACERLREHLIDVRLEGVTDDRSGHRTALLQVLGDDFVTRCVAETSRAELDCSMAAKTLDTFRSCTPPR